MDSLKKRLSQPFKQAHFQKERLCFVVNIIRRTVSRILALVLQQYLAELILVCNDDVIFMVHHGNKYTCVTRKMINTTCFRLEKTFISERSVHFRAQWVTLTVQLLRVRVREI